MYIFDNVSINGQNKIVLSKMINGQKRIISICNNLEQARDQKIACMI